MVIDVAVNIIKKTYTAHKILQLFGKINISCLLNYFEILLKLRSPI